MKATDKLPPTNQPDDAAWLRAWLAEAKAAVGDSELSLRLGRLLDDNARLRAALTTIMGMTDSCPCGSAGHQRYHVPYCPVGAAQAALNGGDAA